MDVCYVVRPGDSNEELRHSLRSVAANLPHRHVVIAGHAPAWTRTWHLPVDQDGLSPANALANLRAILACDKLTETIAIFNDDQYVMAPLEKIPNLHRGPLAQAIAARDDDSPVAQGLRDTATILRRLGYRRPDCYDLHTPLVASREALQDTLRRIDWLTTGWNPDRAARVLWKTIHATLHDYPATRWDDVKVRDLTPTSWPTPLLSTVDLSFTYGAVGRHIRDTFPDPCRYETVSAAP